MSVVTLLTTHFEKERVAMPRGNLEAAMERGRDMRRQRRMAAVAVPAAAILVVAIGVLSQLRSQPGDDWRGDLANRFADANAVLEISDVVLDWETSPAGLGWLHQTATDGSMMYALSTAPGTTWQAFPDGNIPKAIYASSDGLTWTAHPLETPWVSAIGARDGLLYAVGTGPGATAESVALQVGVSRDGGASFDLTSLPTGESRAGVNPMLAVTDEGVLAFSTGEIDFGDESRQHDAFWSADGESFEAIEYPFGNGWMNDVYNVGRSVLAVEAGPANGVRIHASEDALAWRSVASPPGVGWVVDIGEVGDRVVLIGQTHDGRVSVHQAADIDGPWQHVALGDLIPGDREGMAWIHAAAVGQPGVAVSVAFDMSAGQSNLITDVIRRVFPAGGVEDAMPEDTEVVGALLVTNDLTTWSLTPSTDLGGIADTLSFTPDGELLATFTSFDGGGSTRWQAVTAP